MASLFWAGSPMPAAGAKNFLLRRFHFVRLARCLIVEPVQM
jgi:hypothetical protein